ncbi:MAG TPA: UbiA family prenyltransferase [Puia sp.]|nr:UbiA family prenyltransferase [Puia sp.]
MRNILNAIRSHEWWEYKLPPLLALGYATALPSPIPLYKAAIWLIFLLAAIMVGAIYVSIINDITDIKEDEVSGKTNRMASVPAHLRWVLPAICISIGLVCIYFLSNDKLSTLLYALPWISFSLYSFPPVRLKKRGLLGVIADASGSHIFISLLMVSSVSFFTHIPIDWLWFIAVGIWSAAYGLRGILTHQFWDRENDLKVNLMTYATKVDPRAFRKQTIVLIAVELIAFAVMIWRIHLLVPIIFLGFYFALLIARYKIFDYKIVAVIVPKNHPFQILMADYYQLFFPLALLLTATLEQPKAWLVLLVHVLLFPQKMLLIIKDLSMIKYPDH